MSSWHNDLASSGYDEESALFDSDIKNANAVKPRNSLATVSTTSADNATLVVVIHKDKRIEEYWAFLKAVPVIQTSHLPPPPSRCPSLISASTLGSRNSSTRSIKSTVWDAIEDNVSDPAALHHSLRTQDGVQQDPDFAASSHLEFNSSSKLSSLSREPSTLIEPRESTQYSVAHSTVTLRCNFCTDRYVVYGGSQAISQLREHMIEYHGVVDTRIDSLGRFSRQRADILSDSITVAKCSVCTEPFGPRSFFHHLPGCVTRAMIRADPTLEFPTYQEGVAELKSSFPSGLISDDCQATMDYMVALEQLMLSIEYVNYDEMDVDELAVASRCLSLTSSDEYLSSDQKTDYTEEQTSRKSSPGQSQIPRRLTPANKSMIKAVMREFQRYFNDNLQSCATSSSSSSSPNTCSGGWSSTTSISSATTSTTRKRSLGEDNTPPEQDDNGDAPKRRRPASKQNFNGITLESRFACPYYKRNPGKHLTFTSCRDPGFVTAARLKELHQRDPQGCDIREQILIEGFDKDQQQQLKSKKKSQIYQSEKAKWKGVYCILFPDDLEANRPSPFIEYQLSTTRKEESSDMDFQEFSRLQLPQLVRRTLEIVVEKESQPLEEQLKEGLVDIVQECQNQLVTLFQATQGGDSCSKIVASRQRAALRVRDLEATQTRKDRRRGDPMLALNFEDSMSSYDMNEASMAAADPMASLNTISGIFDHVYNGASGMPPVTINDPGVAQCNNPAWTSNDVYHPSQQYSTGMVADSNSLIWSFVNPMFSVASTDIFDMVQANQDISWWQVG